MKVVVQYTYIAKRQFTYLKIVYSINTKNMQKNLKGEGFMIEKISTDKAPKAIGPYSQAVKVGNLVYTSGQIPLSLDGVIVGNDIAEQTHQVMKNLTAVLAAVDCTLDDVFKTTCFLSDMSDFAAFNEIYASYITSAPARSCVAVKSLPKGALVEVEVIACKK